MEPINKGIIDYLREYSQDEPDVLFMYNENGGYTVKELYDTALSLAAFLEEKGVKKCDNVALKGLRTPEAFLLFLAIQYNGAAVVMCDPYNPVEDYIKSTETELKIDHFIDNDGTNWLMDKEPFEVKKGLPFTVKHGPVEDYNLPAIIIFTSGSTGKQKGVILSQYNYINHQRNFHVVGGNEPGDSAIQMLPVFHIFGITQLVDGVMHRCPLFFPKEVTPDYICECIEKYGFTRFGFVPSFALAMADAKVKKGYNTDTLKIAVLAGAYSTREQFNYIQDTLGMRIVPVYGMSELPGISGAGPDEPAEDRASSVGKILPMTEVKITEFGEITVKGPTLFLGYVGEKPVDRNEFFHTGDLGYIDEKGFLHITGRIKDIIIRNGNNLSAKALEEKLLSLSFIREAAVVGVADEKTGEIPAAVVTLVDGAKYNEEETLSLFTKIEKPREIRVLKAMPLNAAGKIDKQKIREMFA